MLKSSTVLSVVKIVCRFYSSIPVNTCGSLVHDDLGHDLQELPQEQDHDGHTEPDEGEGRGLEVRGRHRARLDQVTCVTSE